MDKKFEKPKYFIGSDRNTDLIVYLIKDIFLLTIWVKMHKYTIISYIMEFEWNIWYLILF